MADPLPAKIGKYEVRGSLGEGGFGRVYKAYDPTVGRPVAVKVLTSQGAPDMIARFQNEAQAAGNLHHENIVTIYEFGVYEGAPYIAMEYLEGSDLNQIMAAAQPISLLDKVRIMSQVGQGLQCAHDNGVVHRDVKPANIKVLPNRTVKMMDFGIARLTRDESTRLTQKGDLIGTIRYMSPEQFAGLDMDALGDIFAYGVIFYELVSGAHPFEAPDVASFMYKITEGRPTPLSQLVPGCPPTLQQIVMRAIEKDRDLRYQSLEDLLLDMRPLLLELQKQRAAELFALAHDLYTAGQLARAQAFMREIIDLDSSNPEVWELRERIQQASHRQSVRPKVDTLLKTAETELSRRMFAQAIEALEAAAKLDPADTAIARRIADARQQWDGAIKAARLLTDAGREADRQNLTLAERLGSEALGLDPQNPKVAGFVETMRREIADRENERRLKVALDDARRLAAVEDFDSAIEKLESLKDIRDPSGQVHTLLDRIREQKVQRLRQERLRSEKQSLRGILKESRFADALPRLEALCAEFPEDRDLAELLTDTQQQLHALQQAEDVARAREEAAALQAVSRFAEAEELLHRLAAQYPGDSEIAYMVQTATRAREDYDRRTKLARTLRSVTQFRSDGRFEDAKKALDSALHEFGEDPGLLEERKKLEAEWSAHRRAERVRQSLAAARSRLEDGQFDSAMMLLKQITGEDPQNTEVQDLLQEAQGLAELQRVTRTIDQVCAQARELAASRDFDAASSLLRRTLQSFPGDPRLEGLLDAVSRQKVEWDAEQRLRDALRTATQLLRERRYPEAIHAIEAFLDKHPGEPAMLKLLNQARSEWESSQRADALSRATADIQAALEQNRLDEAAALLEHHSLEFGAATSFIALRGQVEEIARNAERARRIAEAEAQIRALMNQGNREAALQVCQAAVTRDPDVPQLLEWLAGLQQQIARDRRQTEVSKLTGLTRQAIVLKDWNAAAARLEELGRQYPDEPSLTALKDSLRSERRREEAEQALTLLAEALNRRDWPAAEKRFVAAAAVAPDSPRIPEARTRIERGKRRDKALADARIAHKKSRFDEVERLLNPVVSEDTADAEAMELLRDAQSRRSASEAEAAIAQGRKQAKALAKERRFEDAIRILQGLIAAYGQRADVVEDLQQLTTAVDRQRNLVVEAKPKAPDAPIAIPSATQLFKTGAPVQLPDAPANVPWDPDVQFTVYRPRSVAPLQWRALLVFAHRSGPSLNSTEEEPDPIVAVENQATQILAGLRPTYQSLTQDSTQPVAKDSVIRFVPFLPGCEFNPPERSFSWKESVHREEFHFRVMNPAEGLLRGRISVFVGSILVSDIPLSIRVEPNQKTLPSRRLESEKSAAVYRKIFASYSHRDAAVVQEFSAYARSLGDRYLLDVVDLRAGESWNQELQQLIREADVFQLFWSTHSMQSDFVRGEYRYALQLGRQNFVRPVYWEQPLPELPQHGLPPEELRKLHFQLIRPYSASPQFASPAPPRSVSPRDDLKRPGPVPSPPSPVPSPPAWRKPAIMGGIAAAVLVVIAIVVKMLTSPAVPPLTVAAASVPAGRVGEFYSGMLTASGGVSPYRFIVANRSLPPGLALDENTGTLTGSPQQEGVFNFALRATDKAGHTADTSVKVSIEPRAVVKKVDANKEGPPPPPPLKLDTLSLPEGTVGVAYAVTLDASGGAPPLKWTASGLPAGLRLNGRVIQGTPSAEGPAEVVVRVTDSANKTFEHAFSVAIRSKVAPVPPLRITSSLPDGKVGASYNGALTASGGKAPYRWAISGALPAGLQLDANTGTLRGNPSADGRFPLAVRLSDSENRTATSSPTLVIAPETVEKKKSPPPPPAQTNCPAGTPMSREDAGLDSGGSSGTVTWNGPQGTSEVVVIVGKQIRKGPGSVTPQSKGLTGAPVELTLTNAKPLENPSAQNGYRCIAFQPAGSSVKIEWKVNWNLK